MVSWNRYERSGGWSLFLLHENEEGGRLEMDITSDDVNRILDITESFQLPDRLMEVLRDDEKRQQVFESFLEINSDLSYDWFTDYFQENHSNRDRMMQDYTPQSITKILKGIMPKCGRCADICSGTGGLTIAIHEISPEAEYYCVELSERAFPLLLFNLCVRNMKAVAVRQDVLTMETFEIWKITPGGDSAVSGWWTSYRSAGRISL